MRTRKRLPRLSTKHNSFNKGFIAYFPAEAFSMTVIDEIFNKPNVFNRNRPEIKSLRKEESNDLQCAEKARRLI